MSATISYDAMKLFQEDLIDIGYLGSFEFASSICDKMQEPNPWKPFSEPLSDDKYDYLTRFETKIPRISHNLLGRDTFSRVFGVKRGL